MGLDAEEVGGALLLAPLARAPFLYSHVSAPVGVWFKYRMTPPSGTAVDAMMDEPPIAGLPIFNASGGGLNWAQLSAWESYSYVIGFPLTSRVKMMYLPVTGSREM